MGDYVASGYSAELRICVFWETSDLVYSRSVLRGRGKEGPQDGRGGEDIEIL